MKLYMHPVSMTSRPVRLFIAEHNIPVDEHTTLTKYVALRQFFTSRVNDATVQRQVKKVFMQDDGAGPAPAAGPHRARCRRWRW